MIVRFVLRALAGAAVAFGVAAAAPVSGEVVVVAYVVFLGLLAAVPLVPAIARRPGGTPDSAFERALARRAGIAGRPADLVRLEDQVRLAVSMAADVHVRLRPLVAEAAAQRLRTRHGVELERDTAAARALLGDEAWALVRPDAPAPADRFGPGIEPARLGRILDAVEAL